MITYLGVPKYLGLIIMGVFVASFAGTSQIQQQDYKICHSRITSANRVGASENKNFFTNKYGATFLALLTAGILAFSTGVDGKGALSLWPLFGANNQTLAALTLFTAAVYLKKTWWKENSQWLFYLLYLCYL